ncbi:non-ribosomal peptide synthetase [Flavobacterium collinsii]|uniref:D-alanine--D-alanyl carrier protein ligase n=1 Tax=Flavobacterium collinsii TaxID=1114861 RepID=A0ABM8KPS6_9FLAO|nr:non-ribosomal peptide synthetase [Flavobacterium collinsii]CAA9202369.1 D-alanine--D-alanyl carrier protein ligase [Flavobacterium collinsii]
MKNNKMKDIAIIGFSGVFPEAESVSEFSKNLLEGKCSINEISKARLFNTSISDEINCYKGGYLDEITLFDYNFFNISLGEAEEMTPHQRLILQEAYKTFENAGYRPKDLKGSNTSVYVGDTDTSYYLLAEESTPTLIAGNTSAMLASRISRFFDLRGVALNVDTTCSSSLTAITLACKDILLEETDLALVCGVNINVVPTQKDSKIVLGVEAVSESCNPFSEKADGTMGGEAVTCILLKSAEQAIADGDIIYGLIKGFALNQDGGQSASIMAPSVEAQADVIDKALKKAGLTPSDITFIEAHGTGTKLGDPIEIEGLSQVFGPILENDEKVYISAVKSNIGHTDSAAGIVGVIKVLLSFKNNIIYPSINALPLNSYIDFEKAKVEVVTTPISWDAAKKATRKIAGVSSFGLMGTNTHLILESYEKADSSSLKNDSDEYIFCFSAKSETSLINYLQTFQNYLKHTTDSINDISYTLNNYREIYEFRYIAIAKNINHLLEILENVTNEMIVSSGTDDLKESILLFDDSISIDNKVLEGMPDVDVYKNHLLSNAQQSLFVQYSSYQSLVKSGVLINEMIGIGVGKVLLKVLKKEISLEEALQTVDHVSLEAENGNEELKARAEKLISKYSNGLKIIAVGYDGKLGAIFKKIVNDKLCYNVIGYSLPMNENLKVLFKFNFNVDPKAYYYREQFSKIELPSYCFDEKRCWLRTTDNPYDPKFIGFEKRVSLESYDNLPIVEQLQKMWSEILKTEMQEQDDFFDFGGHSLNGSQLINRVNERFFLNLNIDDLFENGTPQDMALLVQSLVKNEGDIQVEQEQIKTVEPQELYEVSFAQKSLWLQAKMSNNSTSLNVPISIIIDGELDCFNLIKAYNAIVERHESLRTTFVFVEGKLKQKINAFEDLEYSIKYEIKENSSKENLNRYVLKLEESPFDLIETPLIRANIIKIENNKHILNITLHHLICDGWSVEILKKELFYTYNALCLGEEPQLPQLKIQYKDYAVWQFERSQLLSFKESESFWLDQYKELPKALNLQLQKPRPDIKTFKGNIDTFQIPHDLTVQIKQLLKEEEITLAMFVGTILNLFLCKLSGESDITIGFPISDRSRKQLENQIGLYLNTIALRSKFNKDVSFKSLIKEVSNNLKLAYKNQIYPFELLVEKLNLQKDYSRSPLFDIVFTVQNYVDLNVLGELENISNNDIKLNHFKIDDYSSAQFDLIFRFMDLENELSYEMEYNTDLFAPETIIKYHDFLINILQQCLSDKNIDIDNISLVSNNDIIKQIQQLSGAEEKVTVNENIVEYLSSICKNHKDNVAVTFENQNYSYEELDTISTKLANYIIANEELKPEENVVVSCDVSPLLIATMIGILKAGLVYVPLDKKLPAQRREYIIEDVQAKLVIDDFWLADFVKNIDNIPSDKVEVKISQEQLAYIIYTSGSTGKPKGVMITHSNLMELMLNCKDSHYDFSENDVWTLYHNYSFDFSIWEIFGPLFFGAKLILIDRAKILDFTEYFKLIKEQGVTVLNFTPKVFVEFDNLRVKKNEQFDSLRYVIFGGDILFPGIFKNWHKSHASCKLINMYGITEITVHGTFKEILVDDIFEKGNISNIGKPIQGLKFYILDEKGKIVPEGVIGEIFIAGNQLSKGYFNKKELTEDRFLEKNYYDLGTLYRSGDLARWLSTGELEYIGRIDSQIKINGFRIELNEIENILLEHQSVEFVNVTSVDEENKTYLLAYFKANQTIDPEELKKHLKKHLPHYMIPDFFVQVDKIELNSNGKIDKSNFPNLQTIKGSKEKSEHNLQGKIIDQIHSLFCEILNYEELPATENFFDLGGSSLQLIQLHSAIDSLWPNKVLISDLFEFNSIEEISSFIDRNLDDTSSSEVNNNKNIEFFEI